jgi:hypothetical protein
VELKKTQSFLFYCIEKQSQSCAQVVKAGNSPEIRLNSLLNLKSTVTVGINMPDSCRPDSSITNVSINKFVAVKFPELTDEGKRVTVKPYRSSFMRGYVGGLFGPLKYGQTKGLG